jgi:hypothetical protein
MAAKKSKKAVQPSKAATVVIEKPATPAVSKKTRAVRKPKQAAPAVPGAYVVIDHPSQNETVSGLHYAIRIGASENGNVEISFNGGEWIPCRPAAGYWWFDWGYFTPGEYTIVARLRSPEGTTIAESARVKCQVI